MKHWMAFLLAAVTVLGGAERTTEPARSAQKVYVLPIRDDIGEPMVFLVRRGVKEAMELQADVLIVDMDTNGGSVASTEKIMQILNEFKGPTVTYVNHKAFSAGAFISFATQKIYMAPVSYIGAAAVIMLSPTGTGVENLPGTLEVKMTSALSALVRAQAEKHGHNPDVAQAMIDKTKELRVDGELLNKEGNILTLTDRQAATKYGQPPKPLLSAGTVESLDALIADLGYAEAKRYRLVPTGAENLGAWLTAISPLLLIIGIVGLYIEFKTPGFGLPGIIGIAAFALYFLGGYAAGFSGLEWVLVFVAGLALVAVELFVFPGTVILGMLGAVLMVGAVVMALVDLYPNPGPGLPTLPAFGNPFNYSLQTILIAMGGSAVAVWILSRFLPKTAFYRTIVSHSASGVKTEAIEAERHQSLLGKEGVTVSVLRPGGKAQFGQEIVDVTSHCDFLAAGTRVRIVGFRGHDPLVEAVN